MSSIKLTFTGDFYYSPLLNNAKPEQIISKEIKEIFDNTDYSIVNLEAPICDNEEQHKIEKTGPHLQNSLASVDALNYLDTNLVCLANNHILDYGKFGIEKTQKICSDNNIETTGAGVSIQEASTPHYVEIKNKKIAFINISENEWSIASDDSAGANPYDIINTVNQIKETKENADIVILVIHGGHEDYSLPSPRMKKEYRFFIDSGANAVIAHHTHCFSGYEIYNSCPIFYSLGNFLFPLKRKASDEWYEGILVDLEINIENKIDFKIHPYVQCKSTNSISVMADTEKEKFLDSCLEKEKIIQDDKELLLQWQKHIQEISKYYYFIFTTLNSLRSSFVKKVFYKLGLKKAFLHKTYLKELINAVQCEAHYDASKFFLNSFLKKH